MTRPLISKILGLNLRIVARIDSLCQEPKIQLSNICKFLSLEILTFVKSVEEKISENLRNVFERVYV